MFVRRIKRFTVQQSLFLIAFLIILIFSFAVGLYEEMLRHQKWYGFAIDYVTANENLIKDNKYTNRKMDLLLSAKTQLLQSHQPSSCALRALITSGNLSDKKVALVNVMTRRSYSNALFKTIVASYRTSDDLLTRRYFFLCFGFLTREQIREFEDDYLHDLAAESHESVIVSAIPPLIEMDAIKVIPFFVKYLKSPNKNLKLMSYVYLKKMGTKYLDEVKDMLQKENDIDTLAFISYVEEGKKP